MKFSEARRRLPIVESLPAPGTRWNAQRKGEHRAPRWVIWELTLACDQRCQHCGPRAGTARSNELTTEEALQVVDELADLGVGEVVLIGGEAYLRNDFLLVIRRIRERGMACTMTTGGLGLTRKRAEAMIEAGIGSVTVSIDGLQASHDKVRGIEGSWKRAFEALRHVRAAGGRVACNSQINAYTMHELEPLLMRLAKEGIHSWQLQITVPHGNAADNPELIIQPYMYPALYEVLDRIVAKARTLGITIWPGNNLGYYGPLEQALRKSQRRFFSGCTAGVSTMGLQSDGSIKNCPSLGGPNNVGGNWREHGIEKVWNESYQLSYIRHRTVDDLWGFCRTCYYAEQCMAGCTAAAEPLMGRPGNNPFCYHRASELASQGLRERIERVSAPTSREGFDNGLFRIVREHLDPQLRAVHGPVSIDEPRCSRSVEPTGPGHNAMARPRDAGRGPGDEVALGGEGGPHHHRGDAVQRAQSEGGYA